MATPLADLAEKLLSADMSADMIVATLRAAEEAAQALAATDPVTARRRAYDRDRMRAKRAEQSADSSQQKERSPTPPKEKLPISKSSSSENLFGEEDSGDTRARRNPRATRLPNDWMPTLEDLAKARELLPAARVQIEIDKFRDHWHSASGPPSVKHNWSAAWRNWCRKAVEMNGFHGGSNGAYRGRGGAVRNRIGIARRAASESDYPTEGAETSSSLV